MLCHVNHKLAVREPAGLKPSLKIYRELSALIPVISYCVFDYYAVHDVHRQALKEFNFFLWFIVKGVSTLTKRMKESNHFFVLVVL